MNIIIPMAGEGKRFKDVGYTVPKYMIKVQNYTIFNWALRSLKNFILSESLFIFIARRQNHSSRFIRNEMNLLGIDNYIIIEIDITTDGQATTALHALKAISDINNPIAIYNIDTYVESKFLNPENIRGHGWIPCFPGSGEHWSFARIGNNGRVIEVREKKRISQHATIGLYYFKSFKLYKDTYKTFYADVNQMESGEKYVAPLYNQLIKNGLDVYIHEVPFQAVHGLGTPEEINRFVSNH